MTKETDFTDLKRSGHIVLFCPPVIPWYVPEEGGPVLSYEIAAAVGGTQLEIHQFTLEVGCPEDLVCVLLNSGLSKDQVLEAVQLLKDFQNMFVGPDGMLGCTSLVEYSIDTCNARPFRQPVCRFGPKEQEIIGQELNKMESSGVIIPSNSPWASPLVLVCKVERTPLCACAATTANSMIWQLWTAASA